LRELIREYVRTGEPVGARRLSKLEQESLSPATIRNVVADLEEAGYVAQPHTSAGRVPTEKGYRLFVSSLLEAWKLPNRQADKIRRSLEHERDPDELMSKTSQVLSTVSKNVGFVTAPSMSVALMKQIQFLAVSERRVLVVLVTRGGLVQHRLIHTDENIAQSELDRAARYLVDNFAGKSLLQIREDLLALMSEEKTLYDQLLKTVVLLGIASLKRPDSDQEDPSEVYLGGASRVIQKPELADVTRMIVLFQAFEEKSRLVKIIGECVKENPVGPAVVIGLERHLPGMQDWALISSPYFYDDKMIGSLGILGPSRMEYEKTIGLVDYVAKLFGEILSSN
jgi:heat-inducible transcriptional repressor